MKNPDQNRRLFLKHVGLGAAAGSIAAHAAGQDRAPNPLDAGSPQVAWRKREDGEQTFFLHPHYTRAKANVAEIMPAIQGLKIVDVTMHPSDRVLTLAVENGLGLRIQMFAAKSNVFLVDKDDMVLNAFRGSRA